MASRYHFQTNARPTLGADIGSALGTGLGKGLTALAETKLNSMLSRQRQAADKQKLVSLGIADHEAEYLSHQDPDTQWQAARAWLVAGGAPDNMLPKQLGDPFNITPEQEAAAREQLGINQPQEQQQPIQGPKTAADFITQQGPMSPQIRQALEGMKLPQGQPEQGASAAMQSIAPQQPMQQPQMQVQQQRPKNLGEAFRIEQQMKKGVDKETADLKKELLRAQIEKTKKAAEGKKEGAKLSPDAEAFVKSTESKAQLARPLLKNLHELTDYIDKHEKEFQTGLISSRYPTALLNEPTRKLKQKMSKILTDMIKADSQGRGSDLMRKIIQEGKFELPQGPNVWREVAKELIDEQEDNVRLSKTLDKVRSQLGTTPDNIGNIVREQVDLQESGKSQTQNRFENLPDPAQFAGKKLRNPKTGETVMSDGTQWKKV